MDFNALYGLYPALTLHIVSALVALVVGPFAIWRQRRDQLHKIAGYIWVVALALTALSGFGIPSKFTGYWLGPIHLLCIYALWGLFDGMRAVFQGNIRKHEATMRAIYIQGVFFTGSLTVLPGRMFQQILFPNTETLGYAVVAAVGAWAFLWPVARRRVLKLT